MRVSDKVTGKEDKKARKYESMKARKQGSTREHGSMKA
jgi:hypothetical protein